MSRAFVRRPALAGLTGGPGRFLRIAAAVSLLGFACASPPARDALLVSVAMSFAPSLGELADTYEAEHPGLTIRINRGASGVLLQQIRQGAPVDLFISASALEMDRLAEEERIDRTRVAALASNRLVLVTPAGTGAIADGELRLERYASIAIANPRTAPLGRYTQQALEATGAWETLGAKAVFGENARQVLEYVARGEVDAGIVYESDALMFAGRVARGLTFDPTTHRPIVYYAAIPGNAAHPEAAADLLRFLLSETGTTVLSRRGFEKPPESTAPLLRLPEA